MSEMTLSSDAPPVCRDPLPTLRFDSTEIDRSPHAVERHVRRLLSTQAGLNVSGLVVHRLQDGVCLTGIVESLDDETDVCDLVRQVAGVNQVVNRLLVRSSGSA